MTKNSPRRILNGLALLLAVSLFYVYAAFGAAEPSSPSPCSRPVVIRVTPLSAEVRAGDTVQFSAKVWGTGRRRGVESKQVIWSINGIPGGNAAVGTISVNGLYISPSILPDSNAIEVIATSVAEPSVSRTALLTLYNPIPTVTSVTPSKVSVGAFTLTVNGGSFVEDAEVLFDGAPLPTTLNSPTQLIASGVATQAQLGSAQVLVRNPEPGSTNSSAGLTVRVTPQPTAASTSWNPTVLGVPWASDFIPVAANQIDVKMDPRLKLKAKGDGSTDDTPAIRGAIQLASASGGGVVYFPVGDYKIFTPSNSVQGGPLVIPSRVILRGASPMTSRIFVNDPSAASETDGTWTWGGIDFQGSSMSGMTDLGVYAVNASTSQCVLLWNRGSTKVAELFFNNLDIHLNNSKSFWFEATDNLLVQNSHIDSNSLQSGPIYIVGNSHVSFLGNKVTYNFSRVHMQNNANLDMQHNTLVRDAENKDMEEGTAIESGGVELSFGQNLQVLGNTIQTLNALPSESGDGEAIMSQQSTIPDVLDAGSATAIASTTLTDANALWGPVTESRLAQYPEVVAILTGSGTGEWRTIQGVNTTTKTLTLNQPWSPVPEVGSLYSIFAWTLMDANIQHNTLIDNPNGIVIWDGCYDCTVQNNTLTNSRGIILRTADTSLDPSLYPEGRREHEVAIQDRILYNIVSNTSGLRPAYIALDVEAFEKDNYRGMGLFNIQVEGNTIQPYAANPDQTYGPIEISQEGFFPCFFFGPALVKAPSNTVFQDIYFWTNSQSVPVTYGSYFSQFATHACATPSAPPPTSTE
jgi:parallel beta-helix repeat protein